MKTKAKEIAVAIGVGIFSGIATTIFGFWYYGLRPYWRRNK